MSDDELGRVIAAYVGEAYAYTFRTDFRVHRKSRRLVEEARSSLSRECANAFKKATSVANPDDVSARPYGVVTALGRDLLFNRGCIHP